MKQKSRKLTVYKASDAHYHKIPQIKFQGEWLQSMGFAIGDSIQIHCEKDKLIISKV